MPGTQGRMPDIMIAVRATFRAFCGFQQAIHLRGVGVDEAMVRDQ